MDQVKVGKFIANLRKQHNMTQAGLADRLNLTDKSISKWETGRGLPDPENLLELSKLFKITINEILAGESLTMVKNIEEHDVSGVEVEEVKVEEASNLENNFKLDESDFFTPEELAETDEQNEYKLDESDFFNRRYKRMAESNLMDLVGKFSYQRWLNEQLLRTSKLIASAIFMLYIPLIILVYFAFKGTWYFWLLGIIYTFITLVITKNMIYLDWLSGWYRCKHCNTLIITSSKEFIRSPHFGTSHYLKCQACNKKSWAMKDIE